MTPINPISHAQSNALFNIVSICALLVVAIHVPVDISRCGERSAFGFGLLLFNEGVARAAVPMFFFVSGYLLAGHFGDEGWYVAAIRKRIRTLLIPYVALNILLLRFRIFKIIGSIGFFGALVALLGTLAIYATWVLLSNPTRQLLILAKGIGVIPICTLAIYKLACKWQFPLIIGRNTMPLFGLQVIVYFVGGIIMSSLGTSFLASSLSMYFVVWTFVSVVCVAIGITLRRLSTRFSSLIVGGR